MLCCFALDGSTVHVVFGNSTDANNIYKSNDQNTDTWVTPVETTDGLAIQVSCNIYERADEIKLAFTYRMSAAFYDEDSVAADATTALSEVKMATQNLFHGPFQID